jgi:hypothetical protein
MSISFRGAPADCIRDGLHGDELASSYCEEYEGGNFIVYLNRYCIGHSLRKKPDLPKLLLWVVCLPLWPSSWSYQVNYGGSAEASSRATKWGAIRKCRRWIDGQAKGEA